MPEDPSRPPALRATDADRDRTLDVLRTAVADGRLDPAEFDERVETVLASRTHEKLAEVTADLGPVPAAAPGGAVAAASAPAPRVPERVTIREKHGVARREGRWVLPHQLRVRSAWAAVTLDLTEAVRSGPEITVDIRARGGSVELILTPDMVVDANGLTTRFGAVQIDRSPTDAAETLYVRLVGRMKFGGVSVRWQEPRR